MLKKILKNSNCHVTSITMDTGSEGVKAFTPAFSQEMHFSSYFLFFFCFFLLWKGTTVRGLETLCPQKLVSNYTLDVSKY